MEENKISVKIVEERFEKFLNSNFLMNSDFLTLEQQSMLAGFLRSHKRDGVYLYGGYPDAERKMVVFLPDYIIDSIMLERNPDGSSAGKAPFLTDDEVCKWFRDNPEDSPVKILNCEIPVHESSVLSHRDYLGALMGEGIKREKIGDILVSPKGAQILAMDEMAEYLLKNYRQVGHATINTRLAPISELSLGEIKTIEEKYNVASPRLDNVVAEVFHISRKLAQEAISKGIVFLDGVQMSKPDYTLKGEEKLVLRGKGKVIYHGVTGQSKKGNSYIAITRYV